MDPLSGVVLPQCVSRVALAVDVHKMVESLASQGLSTVDLIFAVRLHTHCSLREARQVLADLAPAVQEFDPDSAAAAVP